MKNRNKRRKRWAQVRPPGAKWVPWHVHLDKRLGMMNLFLVLSPTNLMLSFQLKQQFCLSIPLSWSWATCSALCDSDLPGSHRLSPWEDFWKDHQWENEVVNDATVKESHMPSQRKLSDFTQVADHVIKDVKERLSSIRRICTVHENNPNGYLILTG